MLSVFALPHKIEGGRAPKAHFLAFFPCLKRFKDNIVIGGLMLCKAPIELVEERTEHFKEQTSNQIKSVDNNLMRENDPRMPLFNERKSKVTFGKGN